MLLLQEIKYLSTQTGEDLKFNIETIFPDIDFMFKISHWRTPTASYYVLIAKNYFPNWQKYLPNQVKCKQ